MSNRTTQPSRSIAFEAHEGQSYGSKPYTYHLEMAARNARDIFGLPVLEDVMWLHDSIEDTPLAPSELNARGVEAVVIWTVYRMSGVGLRPVEKVLRAKLQPLSHAGKYCDALANLRESQHCNDHKRIKKYTNTVLALQQDLPTVERLERYITDFRSVIGELEDERRRLIELSSDTDIDIYLAIVERVRELDDVLSDRAEFDKLIPS